MEPKTLKVGDKAPDFILKNQHEREVKLSDFHGKRVLLSFHPLAYTGVCEIQMKSLEIKHDDFLKLDCVPLGISVDSVYAKEAWAKTIELNNLQILSDFWPHGEVAKAYGQFIEKAGISGRVNIVVGKDGKIELVKRYEILEIPNIEEILDFLKM
jgi:peroxiredoxin